MYIPCETKNIMRLGCGLVLLMFIVILAVIFAIISGISWILLLIWNAVAVAKFSAPVLTYWNMFGITTAIWFIGGLLFGNSVKK